MFSRICSGVDSTGAADVSILELHAGPGLSSIRRRSSPKRFEGGSSEPGVSITPDSARACFVYLNVWPARLPSSIFHKRIVRVAAAAHTQKPTQKKPWSLSKLQTRVYYIAAPRASSDIATFIQQRPIRSASRWRLLRPPAHTSFTNSTTLVARQPDARVLHVTTTSKPPTTRRARLLTSGKRSTRQLSCRITPPSNHCLANISRHNTISIQTTSLTAVQT